MLSKDAPAASGDRYWKRHCAEPSIAPVSRQYLFQKRETTHTIQSLLIKNVELLYQTPVFISTGSIIGYPNNVIIFVLIEPSETHGLFNPDVQSSRMGFCTRSYSCFSVILTGPANKLWAEVAIKIIAENISFSRGCWSDCCNNRILIMLQITSGLLLHKPSGRGHILTDPVLLNNSATKRNHVCTHTLKEPQTQVPSLRWIKDCQVLLIKIFDVCLFAVYPVCKRVSISPQHSFFHFTMCFFSLKFVTQVCSGPGQSEGQTAADQPLSSCWWGNRGSLKSLVGNKQWRYSDLWWSAATNTLLNLRSRKPAGLRKQQPNMARKSCLKCIFI